MADKPEYAKTKTAVIYGMLGAFVAFTVTVLIQDLVADTSENKRAPAAKGCKCPTPPECKPKLIPGQMPKDSILQDCVALVERMVGGSPWESPEAAKLRLDGVFDCTRRIENAGVCWEAKRKAEERLESCRDEKRELHTKEDCKDLIVCENKCVDYCIDMCNDKDRSVAKVCVCGETLAELEEE